MVNLGALSAHITQNRSLTQSQAQAPADDTPADATSQTPDKVAAGVTVSLSGVGLAKSAAEKNANANKDIEESGLPGGTQKLLKMIRELKQKIEQKQAELQAVMNDQSLSPQERQTKVGALQSELATLVASLATASSELDKQSKNGTLTPEQGKQAAILAMKK